MAALVVLIGIASAVVLVARGHHTEQTRAGQLGTPPLPTGSQKQSLPCPGTVVATSKTGPDGLPPASAHTDDAAHVQAVVRRARPSLRAQTPDATSITLAEGDGYLWTITSTGRPTVEHRRTYEVLVMLPDLAACPRLADVNETVESVPVRFVYEGFPPNAPPPTSPSATPTTLAPVFPAPGVGGDLTTRVTITKYQWYDPPPPNHPAPIPVDAALHPVDRGGTPMSLPANTRALAVRLASYTNLAYGVAGRPPTYVGRLVWVAFFDTTCMGPGGPYTPGTTKPRPPPRCHVQEVVDARTGTLLFTQSQGY